MLQLLIVFAVIIVVMWLKQPLSIAVLAAIACTVFLYHLPLNVTLDAIIKGTVGRTTIEVVLVFYSITFLQRMLEKRKNLSNSQVALNGIFNNRRINASIAPFLLGCLPAASTVLLCGPIVRDSIGDNLSTPEKAAITSYFRHISESFLPTYTSIYIALSLTNGAVTVSMWLIAMFPMVICLFIAGYAVYLRRVPKDTGMKPDHSKDYYWMLLLKSIWTILLSIALILALKLPVACAVFICIVLNFFVNKFSVPEILPFFRSAFEVRLIVSSVLVLIFKEVLAATGVIQTLPGFFSTLPIPTFLVYALISFFGSAVAGSTAIIVLCMPMLMASLNGAPALGMFVLFMSMNYIAMQVSPVHICLTLCAEDYRVSLGALIRKTIPMLVTFTTLSFAYYFALNAFGF